MGNDRAKFDRRFHFMSGAVAHADLRPALLQMIARRFRPLRAATEMLARESHRSPRAARNWLDELNAPDASALLELMAANETLADEVIALVAARRRAREGEICPG